MVNSALDAADRLAEQGVSAEVIKLGCVLPNSFALCMNSLRKTGRLLVAEDVCAAGCVGERLLAEAGLQGVKLRQAKLINLGDGLVTHGSVPELMKLCGLDAASLAVSAQELINGERV